MGVRGLWRLVLPVGNRISIETLTGKKLAIDASIWLIQFLKANRDPDTGSVRPAAHLIGFFRRICKLLYHGIKPIFVFDGPTPEIKLRELRARRERREKLHLGATSNGGDGDANVKRLARRILVANLKKQKELERKQARYKKANNIAPNASSVNDENDAIIIEDQNAKHSTSAGAFAPGFFPSRKRDTNDSLDQINNDNGDMADNLANRNKTDESNQHVENKDNGESILDDIANFDLGPVPAMSPTEPEINDWDNYEDGENSNNHKKDDSDYKSETDDDGSSIDLPNNAQDRLDPTILANMPSNTRTKIIEQAQRNRRMESRSEFMQVAANPDAYSQTQLKNFLKSCNLNKKITEVGERVSRGALETNSGDDIHTSGIGEKIASDASRRYIFTKTVTETEKIFGKDGKLKKIGDRDNKDSHPQLIRKRNRLKQSHKKSNCYESADHDDHFLKDSSSSAGTKVVQFHPGVLHDDSSHDSDAGGFISNIETKQQIVIEEEEDPEIQTALLESLDKSESEKLSSSRLSKNDDTSENHSDMGGGFIVTKNEHSSEVFDVEAIGCDSDDNSGGGGFIVNDNHDPSDDERVTCDNKDIMTRFTTIDKSSSDQLKGEMELQSLKEDLLEDSHLGLSKEEKSLSESKITPGGYAKTEDDSGNDDDDDDEDNIDWEDGDDSSDFLDMKKELIPSTDSKESRSNNDPEVVNMETDTTSNVQNVNTDRNERSKSTENEIESSFQKVDSEENRIEANENSTLPYKAPLFSKSDHVSESDNEDESICWEDGYVDHNMRDSNINQQEIASSNKDDQINDSEGDDISWEDGNSNEFLNSDKANVNQANTAALKHAQMTAANLTNWAGRAVQRAFSEYLDEDKSPDKRIYDSRTDNKDDVTESRRQSGLDGNTVQIDSDTTSIESEHDTSPSPKPTVERIGIESIDTSYQGICKEDDALREDFNRQQRDMEATITDEMKEDILQLLSIFGIPWVEAPAEAEAQCATLEELLLVDGVVTEDSDAFVFGAKNVYKNLFDDKKYVEVYRSQEAEKVLGVCRNEYIALAMMLGGDYTSGIKGVGIVNGMEVIQAFPVRYNLRGGLQAFRKWLDGLDIIDDKRRDDESDAANDNENNRELHFRKKHKSARTLWQAPKDFPAENILQAYSNPVVDKSRNTFSWGEPDLENIRLFAESKMGWNVETTDNYLVPVLNQMKDGSRQTRLDSYFMRVEDNIKFANVRSKRLREVLNTESRDVQTQEKRSKKTIKSRGK